MCFDSLVVPADISTKGEKGSALSVESETEAAESIVSVVGFGTQEDEFLVELVDAALEGAGLRHEQTAGESEEPETDEEAAVHISKCTKRAETGKAGEWD